MAGTEVLVLHGAPGSGKTTVGRAVTERLIAANLATGMIDVDALALVYPPQGRAFSRKNLRAVWSNYAAVEGIRIVLPLVVVDDKDLADLHEITDASRFVVCELTAPREILERRVTEREPNELWASLVLKFIALYHDRDDHRAVRDFQVSTHPESVEESADHVLRQCGWHP
jgi:adenylylsulfate kinase-like enzyme